MDYNFNDQMSEFNKTAAKSFNDFNKMMSNIVKRTTTQGYEFTNMVLGDTLKQMGRYAGVKKLDDLLSLSAEMATENSYKMIRYSQQLVEMSMENFSEINKYIEDVVSKTASAAHSTTKGSYKEKEKA